MLGQQRPGGAALEAQSPSGRTAEPGPPLLAPPRPSAGPGGSERQAAWRAGSAWRGAARAEQSRAGPGRYAGPRHGPHAGLGAAARARRRPDRGLGRGGAVRHLQPADCRCQDLAGELVPRLGALRPLRRWDEQLDGRDVCDGERGEQVGGLGFTEQGSDRQPAHHHWQPRGDDFVSSKHEQPELLHPLAAGPAHQTTVVRFLQQPVHLGRALVVLRLHYWHQLRHLWQPRADLSTFLSEQPALYQTD